MCNIRPRPSDSSKYSVGWSLESLPFLIRTPILGLALGSGSKTRLGFCLDQFPQAEKREGVGSRPPLRGGEGKNNGHIEGPRTRSIPEPCCSWFLPG